MTAELLDFERRKVVFTIDRFRTFAKTRQAMLFPPFQMLQALQARIMGISFWERQSDKRMKLSNGKFLSVGQFIAAVSLGFFCAAWFYFGKVVIICFNLLSHAYSVPLLTSLSPPSQHNGGKITKAQRQYISLSTPGPSRDDDSQHKPPSLSLGVQPMDLSQVAGPRAKRRQSAAEAQVRCVVDCFCFDKRCVLASVVVKCAKCWSCVSAFLLNVLLVGLYCASKLPHSTCSQSRPGQRQRPGRPVHPYHQAVE